MDKKPEFKSNKQIEEEFNSEFLYPADLYSFDTVKSFIFRVRADDRAVFESKLNK